MPQPNDLLSDSQGDLLQNFSAANTSFGINHYEFDDATVNNGKHKFVSMPVTTTPVTVANEGVLYTKAIAGGTALFFARDVASDVQLTTPSVVTPLDAQDGYSWLPGGLFMQWGFAAITAGSGAKVINFPVAFSASAYNVQITPVRSSTNVDIVYMVSTTSTNFTCFTTASGGIANIYWCAIGPKA